MGVEKHINTFSIFKAINQCQQQQQKRKTKRKWKLCGTILCC